jgi:hypothetical protein
MYAGSAAQRLMQAARTDIAQAKNNETYQSLVKLWSEVGQRGSTSKVYPHTRHS